jgi:uncharacterized protein YggU (UPF0235/DUF167 family)
LETEQITQHVEKPPQRGRANSEAETLLQRIAFCRC